MENEITEIVQDISAYMLKRLESIEESRNNKTAIHQSLKRLFQKTCSRSFPDCGIITTANKTTFPAFQLLYYSIVLKNPIPIAVYDLGMTPKQLKWCNDNKINCISLESIQEDFIHPVGTPDWQTWNKPIYLLKSPYNNTLWLDPNCIVFEKLDFVFDNILNNLFVIEDVTQGDSIGSFHLAMQTNLVPHQSGPPIVNAGVLGVCLPRDKALLDSWAQAIKAVYLSGSVHEHCRNKEHTCLQWAIEMNGHLEQIKSDFQWNNVQYEKPKSNNVLEALTKIHTSCRIANTGNSAYSWKEEVPINFISDIATQIGNISDKCTFFLTTHEKLENKYCFRYLQLEDSPLEDSQIYLRDDLQFDTEYVGIFPANLKARYPKVHFNFQDIDVISPQLDVDTVLGLDVAPAHWANMTNNHAAGIILLIQELAKEFDLIIENPSIGGNAFICHHTVFEELLMFWKKAYDYLFNKYGLDFKRNKASLVYGQITMLFFANCKKQISPILDRYLKTNLEDDLPYGVYQFNGIIEAKFLDSVQARNYCESNRYRYS